MSLALHGTIFLAISAVLFSYVNNAVPSPFIDEIFHIPQTQKYCNGSFFEWNNKITTLPGLYIVALVLQFLLLLSPTGHFCSLSALRSVNVVFNVVNLFLIYYISKTIHSNGRLEAKKDKPSSESPTDDKDIIQLQSLSLATFPLLYFFSFIYYTDPGSTMFVLAAYLANLQSKHKLSALLGFTSVLFRQTNIVWVIFMAGCTVAKELMRANEISKIETSPDIKDKLARFLADIIAAVTKYLLVVDNLRRVLYLIWPYACVVVCFGIFVIINGGIVVGDKSNHTVSFHGPQLLYFLGFTLFFASPILISRSQIQQFSKSLLKRPLKYVSFAVIFFFLILKCTHVHKFILADNRHYTFYLWRLILRHRLIQFGLIPFYIYSGWSIHHSLNSSSCTRLWKLMFLICIIAVTVPQKLIEPRYFIIPYIIFRVNVIVKDKKVLIMELMLYTLINAFTFFIFFYKTFDWPDIPEPQRIIW